MKNYTLKTQLYTICDSFSEKKLIKNKFIIR